jgi:ACS family hexuronate transporter-like MFS transporter
MEAPPSEVLPRGLAWRVSIVAMLAMSVSYADRQVLAAVATSVRSTLHVDALEFGWLAAGFSAAYLVAAPLAGGLIDRVGAKRGLATSVALWSLVAAAHALAPGFGALLALRVLLGIAEAPSFPAAAQAVRRVLPGPDRSLGFGLLFTGSSIGAATVGPLAVWLNAHFGWQGAFAVTAGLGTAWIPCWLLVCADRHVGEALSGTQTESGVDAPRVPLSAVLADRSVLRAMSLVLCSAPVIMLALIWLPQYLELARMVPRNAVGRYLWVPPVFADAGMVGFGFLARPWSARLGAPHAEGRLFAVSAGLGATLMLAPYAPGPWASVFLVGLACAGSGGMYTLLTTDMIRRIDPARVGAATGLTAAAQSLVYIVLNPLVGAWVDRTRSFDVPVMVFGAMAGVSVLVWARWRD